MPDRRIMRVAVRADAALHIGAGHVMRCLTLADMLRDGDVEILFVCRAHDGHMAARIEARGYKVALLPLRSQGGDGYEGWLGATVDDDAAETAQAIGAVDLLIADHYGIDARWERVLRAVAKRILVIDDLADRAHEADFLLDQTAGRAAADYASLVPGGCRLMVGVQYALLRPDFAARRAASLARRADGRVRHILVALGGFDPANHTAAILRTLAGCGLPSDHAVTVVLGAGAPHLGALRELAASLPITVSIQSDVADMAAVMADSDLAIGAAGTTAWERCALGLPTIMLVLADNQRLIADNLARAGAALVVERVRAEHVAMFLDDPALVRRMTARAAALCDGRGAERVAAILREAA